VYVCTVLSFALWRVCVCVCVCARARACGFCECVWEGGRGWGGRVPASASRLRIRFSRCCDSCSAWAALSCKAYEYKIFFFNFFKKKGFFL
jgi:hypothetical protein